jgi:myo-inositol-1(or 4)-monophosphatase
MSEKLNISTILDSVRKAGDMFLNDFKHTEIPQDKEQLLLQLEDVDARSKSVLEEALKSDFPEIPFYLGDEFDSQGQTSPLALPEYWLCDAMDGAIQYLQHIPGWTINLVLVRGGEAVFSVIYDPLAREMFHAELGSRAYMNGKPIKTSLKKDKDAMIAVFQYGHQESPAGDLNKKHGEALTGLLNHFGVVRNYGPHGLQLAYIGTGRIDLFYQLGLDTFNWLAEILIAREAGAAILNSDGGNWRWGDQSLVVSAAGVAEEFIRNIQSGTNSQL